MKYSRFIALLLSLALLCTLCGCVTAPAVSEPESEPTTTTASTAAASATTTEASTTTTIPTISQMEWSFPEQLFPTMLEFRAAYQACQKMSYKEYVSEPRYLFSEYQTYRTVKPLKSEPTLLVYADENGLPYTEERGKVYFDTKKHKKDAKAADGGYEGDDIIDFFRVDDEIWRWHIPSDTVDVVVRNHEKLVGVRGVSSDVVLCFIENDNPTEEFPWDNRPAHYHVISKNLTLPYADVPHTLQEADLFLWFQKNVYNKK